MKLTGLKSNISGGIIPSSVESEYTAERNGIIVKSDDSSEIL